MTKSRISIAKDFSRFPAGRFYGDGPFPGQKFREEILVPALKAHKTVTVVFDAVYGSGSSFLEEAFGGLVRLCGFTAAELHNRLILEPVRDPTVKLEVWQYIDDAKPQSRAAQG